jgi:uncharacterized protein (TIGR02246 family)
MNSGSLLGRTTIAIALLLILQAPAFSADKKEHSADEAAIRQIVANLADAWTKGDAKMWADQFTDDADFTAWMGSTIKGREAILRGHDALFTRVYKDTKQRINVDSVRFLSDNVAAVQADATVVKRDAAFPETPHTVFAAILVKQNQAWKIAVFHNTRVHTREEMEAFRAKQDS